LFSLLSSSQLSLSLTHTHSKRHLLLAWFNFCWERGREEKHAAEHAAAADRFLGKGRIFFSLLLVFIPPLKEM
jgi:hypothetical protein